MMRVLFFAQLREVTGCGECCLEEPGALTTDELWACLEGRFPGLSRHRRVVRLARNSEYATAETRFLNGDEVALIPPVSGG